VNNTGGPPALPLLDTKAEDMESAFRSHLSTAHILSQLLVPGMKKSGYGRIVNIVSTSVKQPIPRLGISNTVRAAVANWAKTLSEEIGRFGITVNNVLPGYIKTDRLNELFAVQANASGQTPDQIIERSLSVIPAGRLGEPQEIAAAIAFLCSPAAAYINGINLPIDGGRTSSL
jgi:3-oxoacyl-[acyl-carrier protein] reductase